MLWQYWRWAFHAYIIVYCKFVNTMSWKPFVGISQIIILSAVRDKDELIGSWGQKVKGQGHSETWYG